MFVVGCHRSGTSLLASLLRDTLNLDSNSDDKDLQIALDNPRGFYESKRLQKLNDTLLESMSCSWDKPPLLPPNWSSKSRIDQFHELRSSFMEQALNIRWIDKDPRLCITYGAYTHIMLRRVILAAIVRDPLEVATSLYLRNAMPIERGLAIWFLYNHHLAFHLQKGDQIFDYAQLLRGKYSEGCINSPINSINSLLEQIAQPVLQKKNIEAIFQRRISKDLNRSATGLPAMPAAELPVSRLLPICEEAMSHWRASEDQLRGWREAFGSIPLALSQVLSDKSWHSNLCPKSEGLTLINELAKKQDEIMALKLEHLQITETLQQRLENINNSTSWKITSPLRWYANRLKH